MSTQTWSPIPLRWLWLGAGGVSLVFVMNAWIAYNLGPAEQPFDWFFEGMTLATNYFLWAAVIPALFHFVIARESMWRLSIGNILVHLVLSVLIAMLHRYTALGLYVGLTWIFQGYLLDLFGAHSLAWVFRGTIPSFIQYWLIVALLWGFRYYQLKRLQEMELIKKDQEIANAQFNALKMQLHPHFFFNTLNTISSVMDRNVEDAQNIVAKLAKLMRSLVDSDKRQFTSLAKELEYIGDYLHIEQARFGDSLSVSVDIEPEVNGAEIPNLLLQPLIENSIKHGFGQVRGEKRVRIHAEKIQERLQITIQDNGVGVASVDYVKQNPGVGLKSVISRLNHIYGQFAGLEITSKINQGFLIELSIPFKQWKG